MEPKESFPLVGVIMGSDSDLPTMKDVVTVLQEFGISYELRIVSAHRTPRDMFMYAETAHMRGLRVIIAGAGGAAHLPGMVASLTPLPVIGVPILSKSLNGLDSLLSIVQMPTGVPVATVAIGGAKNAGILAAQIVAINNKDLQQEILDFKAKMAEVSRNKNHSINL
ncbi:MAG: 5-(carboxyamino)imidazole ribonucleotide mutase [Blastocatellia bacterium]|nr:5-(carboxyamino)imidazole ribonucleotide mutase [Blastocatellia bacterium]